MKNNKPTFYCIDGNSYIHRAYHALPMMTNSEGQPTNAVFGFIKLITKLIRTTSPEYIAVCFDSPGPTKRHDEYEQYKATRKPTDKELKSQFPLVHEVVKAMNIDMLVKPGYEADDIIATLCKKATDEGIKTVIITSDKDAYQLVNDSVGIYNEQSGVEYDREKVKEKMGVNPEQIVDLLALMGDSSDNVPGVKGIGQKTAVSLLQQFNGLDNIYKNLNDIKGKVKENLEACKEEAYLSKKLVTLFYDVPVENDIIDFKIKKPNIKELIEVYSKLGFKSMIEALQSEKPQAPEQPQQVIAEKKEEYEAGYKLIDTQSDVKSLADDIKKDGIFSFEVVSDGESPMRSEVMGMAVTRKNGKSCYVDLTGSRRTLIKIMEPVFSDGKITKCVHDLKRNIILLRGEGIFVNGSAFDSMIASYVLDPAEGHGIERVALSYLNYKISDKEKDNKTADTGLFSSESAGETCRKSSIILRLKTVMEKELAEKGLEKLFREVEMPLAGILAEMEMEGIFVNKNYLAELSKEFNSEMLKLEKNIYELAGQDFNINSPKQLSFILFEKLRLPVMGKTKSGYSTSEDVLVQLQACHALPALMISYRELQKLKSTYIDALGELINPDTGRIHSSFNQTVTATGRLSSSEPNMQNIPIRSELGRKIRSAFIPEDGYVFISADYSQIDLRVLAHISEDENLLDSFRKNQDVHTRTACEIFNVKPEEVTPEMRRMAKVVNFGLSYGMGPQKLARDLSIPVSVAKNYIQTYFKKYKGVKKYMDSVVKQAGTDGYVCTILNRRRYLPDINSSNRLLRNNAEKMAINTPIQGSSSDIIKVAMVNIEKSLKEQELKSRMIVQIHDELLFEVYKGEEKEITAMAKKEMENSVQLKVPLAVDVKTGSNWGELK